MSKLGVRVSWAVILFSLLFIAGYLVRGGRRAEGRAAAPPVVAPAPAGQAVPGRASPGKQAPVTSEVSGRQTTAAHLNERALVHPETGPGAPNPTGSKPAASGAMGPSPTAQPVSAKPSRLPPPPQPDANAPAPEDAPHIQMQETTFDFGEIYQMEEITHEFVFTNTGKGTIAIGNITASCGCTVVTPSKKELAAGEQGTLKVTFKAGRYRDRVTKHIYVDSNDPATPRVILTMTGVVKIEVEVTPTGIYTGRLKVGQSLEQLVTITPVEVKSFKILEIKTDHPALSAEAQPIPDKPGSYQVRVRLGPMEKAERINAKVIIHTDLPHTKELSIAVFGRVEEPTASNPPPAPQ